MNQSRDKHALLGDVPRLPLRVAVQVAKSSIKVRLSRSLVTVSSVILAVAFLLVVMGEDISDRAVYGTYSVDQQPSEDLNRVTAVLTRPRTDRQLLHLLGTEPEIRSWAQRFGQNLPDFEPAQARDLERLGDWIEDLKATDRFQILGTTELIDWILHFDAPQRSDRFLERVDLFRGVRLPLTAPEIAQLVEATPALRDGVGALARAERERLALVADAGGTDAVIDRIANGTTDPTALGGMGVPVEHIFDRRREERLLAMAEKARLIDLTIDAQQALSRANRALPAVAPLGPDVLLDDELGSLATPIRSALSHLDATQRERLHEAILETGTVAPLREALATAPDGEEAIDLADTSAAQAYLGQVQVDATLEPAELEALVDHLRDRSRLNDLRESFRSSGFDPEAGGERTFWLLVLSFLVCVVGIVNSMMMAVTERFREIATMKCLGAMDSFIMKAFLIESGSVGVVGAVLGAILGIVIVVIQAAVRYGGTYWSSFPGGMLGLAAVAALGCGILLTIIGALLPAFRAARMHPIEAMRLEA